MIPVTTNALAPKHRREAQPLGDYRFGNMFIGILRLANNEFADLRHRQLKALGVKSAIIWRTSLPAVQYR